ncbi:MAG: type I restriction-modification enzyme R subunit C-terminal domain-containing protein [Propionibacteriaceae bacterium]
MRRAPVYTDFEDELGEQIEIALPGGSPATDIVRFRAKALAYLREHEDNVTLQRLRRNRQLTPSDMTTLEQMLLASGAGQKTDVDRVASQTGGLGLFIRSLVGLDRAAASEAFETFLDQTRYSVEQVRFLQLIIDELTRNWVMEPSRLYESPTSITVMST